MVETRSVASLPCPIDTHPDVKIPPLPEVIQMYEIVASAAGAMQQSTVTAIALNTGHLDQAAAKSAIDRPSASRNRLTLY